MKKIIIVLALFFCFTMVHGQSIQELLVERTYMDIASFLSDFFMTYPDRTIMTPLRDGVYVSSYSPNIKLFFVVNNYNMIRQVEAVITLPANATNSQTFQANVTAMTAMSLFTGANTLYQNGGFLYITDLIKIFLKYYLDESSLSRIETICLAVYF
jgi:hypothetical protein